MNSGMIGRVLGVLAGRTTARGAQLVVFILLARSLSPGEFGWYGIFTTSVLLASALGSIGLRQAVAYKIGRNTITAAMAFGCLLRAWPILSLISAAFVFGAIGLSLPLESRFNAAIFVLISVAGAMAVILVQGLLLGMGRTGEFSITDTLLPIGILINTVLMWLTESITFFHVIIAFAVSQSCATIISGYISGRGLWRKLEFDIRVIPRLVRDGFPFAVNVFLVTLSVRISLYLVEKILSAHDAGMFFAGQRVGDMLTEAATALGLVLFSDTVRSTDPDVTTLRNVRIGAWIFWTFTVGAIAMVWLAEPIVSILLGSKYSSASGVLAITAFSIGPTAATKVIYPTISGHGKPMLGNPVIVASVIANLAGALILVPRYGLSGACWALVCSQFVLFFGYGFVMHQFFRISWRDIFLPQLPKRRTQ